MTTEKPLIADQVEALLPFADQGFEDFAALVGLLGEEWYEAAKAVMRRLHSDTPEPVINLNNPQVRRPG